MKIRRPTDPTTRGLSHTFAYRSWVNMLQRCDDQRHKSFKDYGARGITICERWRVFGNFLADMGERPAPGMTLERRDNDKGYSPDNCEWADKQRQSANRRSCIYLDINGERKTISEWARHFGVNKGALFSRIYMGWAPERAVSTPIDRRFSRTA
jgi:hypothetical protein